MIKITKPGQKEFHGFCKWCGCEFTYEISDLKLSATSDKVSCPTCGKDYYHLTKTQELTITPKIPNLQWPHGETITDSCAGCAWRAELLAKGSYIGDTPCDFCNKNPYKVTCLQTSISTSDYPKAVYGTSRTEVYKTPCDAELDYNQTSASCCDGVTYTLQNTNSVYSPKDGSTVPPAPPTSGSNAVKSCNSCSVDTKCGGKKNCKGKH